MKDGFYLYFLRRPDEQDPFESGKGQPFYVGKGCNGRIGDHRLEAKRLLHKSGKKIVKIAIIHKLWKQGLDFEEDIILDNLSEQDAFDLEVGAIEEYGRIDLGTGCLSNMTNGGEGISGLIMTDEHKKRIGEAQKGEKNHNFGKEALPEVREKNRQAQLGRRHTPETRRKISLANLGNTSFSGRKHSPETIEKISQNNLGKHFSLIGQPKSEEHKKKISQALIGKPHSEERKEKNRQSHIGLMTEEAKENLRQFRLGKPSSLETKEKISQSLTGRVFTEEHKENMSRAQLLRYQRQREAKGGGQ